MPYAIMRFAKRKRGTINSMEAHNERKKEEYKSNPDISARSKYSCCSFKDSGIINSGLAVINVSIISTLSLRTRHFTVSTRCIISA